MDSERKTKRRLPDYVAQLTDKETGLNAAQIAVAYRALLEDFTSGETSRGIVSEVSKLLARALECRKQELAEREHLSSQKVDLYY